MPRKTRMLWFVLALSTLASAGCKQKSKEESEPTAAPSASAAPAETAPPTPPLPPDTIAPPTQPSPPTAVVKTESIKSCCDALHKEETTVAASQKSLYQTAATSCDAIAKLVSSGTTKKAAALTQIRASLKGGKLPAGCD